MAAGSQDRPGIASADIAAVRRLARAGLGTGLRRWLDSAEIASSALRRALVSPLDPRGRPAAWARLVANTIRDKARWFRRRRRDGARTDADDAALAGTADPRARAPDDAAARAEEGILAWRALDLLPAGDREIVVAVRIDGRPLAAVAVERGWTYARARHALLAAEACLRLAVRGREAPHAG